MLSPTSAAQRRIPQYSLYGEATQDVDQFFLHVESIAERSRLHDWTIQPHAHRDLHHLLLIDRGGGALQAETEVHEFTDSALIKVPQACVHSFRFLPGTDGWIVTASGALTSRIFRDHPALAPILDLPGVVIPGADAADMLCKLFTALVAEFRGRLPARRAAAEACLTSILVQALRCELETAPDPARAPGADAELAAKYRALVDINFARTLRVADYADLLCVSHERLRQACVRTTASAPLELLNARRLLEAKRGLLYTSMNIALIALSCGFEDPAYFSRFFARATGQSPLQYRKAQTRRQHDS